jgi:quercetin dioxygenase-like cupin family protein
MQVIKKSDLPSVRLNGEVAAHIFDGGDHGGISSSAFIVDVAPGTGPRRHKHPYDEVFVIIEGTIRLEAGGEVIEATPEEICVVPAGVPHGFTNIGSDRARMVNIHVTAKVVTEFVEDPSANTDVTYEYNHTH